jgi:hypothetical protein
VRAVRRKIARQFKGPESFFDSKKVNAALGDLAGDERISVRTPSQSGLCKIGAE